MTIVVGLPRDERAAAALHLGAMLARSLGRDVVVCTVVPPPWPPGMGKVDAEYQDYLDRSAEQALDDAREVLPADAAATYVVTQARSTSAGLLEVAAEHGATLLALGSSTAGVLGRV
ncbi:MAG: universal stress protein, partial [Pseudonocardia sp.]|nr:universal stress protein [Pseudonocardia sp.]